MADSADAEPWFPYLDDSARLMEHMEEGNGDVESRSASSGEVTHRHYNNYSGNADDAMDDSVFGENLADGVLSHCHPQLTAKRDRRAERTLIAVSILTVFFVAGEFTGKRLPWRLSPVDWLISIFRWLFGA